MLVKRAKTVYVNSLALILAQTDGWDTSANTSYFKERANYLNVRNAKCRLSWREWECEVGTVHPKCGFLLEICCLATEL